MPLSWNDIRARAATFAREWKDETQENAGAQTFWNEFFAVFGVDRKRVAVFEKKVTQVSGLSGRGRIDLLWSGRLLAEHKSRGKDLDAAFTQAQDYFAGLHEDERPKYVVVSDFARLRLYDLEAGTDHEFPLEEFPQHVERFGFIAGFQQRHYREQDAVNVKAAEKMALLHDELERNGFRGHQLERLLVRLLFLLFADDTGLFDQNGLFYDLIEATRKDGSDLGPVLAKLFEVLDTPFAERQKTLDERYEPFPHVNGELFKDPIRMADFDAAMRSRLLEASSLDWGKISPAIFGAMVQGVMNKKERRALGVHYTSEANILKALGPLVLDDLKALREAARNSATKLKQFLDLLPTLRFLDPACGCGNFLILAYRELRRLELDALAELHKNQQVLDVATLIRVHVGQFHGIEYEEFPSEIARVAMWLTDHQMNIEASLRFGRSFVNLPLSDPAHILQGDALEVDWEEQLGLSSGTNGVRQVYLVGNPPFVGSKHMTPFQHEQIKRLFNGVKDSGILDYVCGWYYKAAALLHRWKTTYPDLETGAALVSTNSITQGEQVAPLWGTVLNDYSMHLTFAHRTFKWSNEAKGKAAVHCVIIGFGPNTVSAPQLFDYPKVNGPATELAASTINPYLMDGPTILIYKARVPLRRGVPPIHFGNMPLDGGHLLLQTQAEHDAFLKAEPGAAPFVKVMLDAQDFLNGGQRWALWLDGAEPHELQKLPRVVERVAQVRAWRLGRKAPSTRKFAATPGLFRDRILPRSYIAVPGHTSVRREYIPMGYLTDDTIVNNAVFMVPDADLFQFGIMQSKLHTDWVRITGGRIKSDYRYSKYNVYNTFPWPDRDKLTPKQIQRVTDATQTVLDVRDRHHGNTLAALYDPNLMPPDLRAAHDQLDRAVEACYRKAAFRSETERVTFLLEEYKRLAPAQLSMQEPLKKKRKKQLPT